MTTTPKHRLRWYQYSLRSLFVLTVLVAIAGSWFAARCGEEQKPKKMTSIRAEDIEETVQIIGRLGQPLGSLLTIQGRWIRQSGNVKDTSPRFHVDVVNGKKLSQALKLHGTQVVPVSRRYEGRRGKPGDTWDWRYHVGGPDDSPRRSHGETWEMMGFETGVYHFRSAEVRREIGVRPDSAAYPRGAFDTWFEFIAVRKVK